MRLNKLSKLNSESELKLNNELRILPLRQYEVSYIVSIDQNDVERNDTFTADFHDLKEGRNLFFRTGNIVREYQRPLIRIIVTPVDAEEKSA